MKDLTNKIQGQSSKKKIRLHRPSFFKLLTAESKISEACQMAESESLVYSPAVKEVRHLHFLGSNVRESNFQGWNFPKYKKETFLSIRKSENTKNVHEMERGKKHGSKLRDCSSISGEMQWGDLIGC